MKGSLQLNNFFGKLYDASARAITNAAAAPSPVGTKFDDSDAFIGND